MTSTRHESQSSDEATRTGAASGGQDPFVEVINLGRVASSRSQYARDVLRLAARFFESPYAAIHMRYASEVIHDDCHLGATDPKFWKPSLQQFLTESLAETRPRAKVLRSRKGNTNVAFLSSPMFDASGPAIGALSLVVTPIEEKHVATMLARLEALCRLASVAVELQHRDTPATPTSSGRAQAQIRAAKCDTVEQLAFTITNELRNKLGCEQVALGMVNRKRVKIVSISGLDEVKKQSPGVACVLSAMEECHDARDYIVFQNGSGWSSAETPAAYRLHKNWHASAQGDSVATIPLCDQEATVALLSIRNRSDDPFTAERVEEIRSRVEPFAPALMLSQRANRRVSRHVVDNIRDAVDALATPGAHGRKLVAGAIGAFLIWFIFGTLNYDLAVPAVVTAAQVRQVSVPFDGMLASSSAVEGDRVSKGDVLCRFDDRDLLQEREQLIAERSVLEHVMNQARAGESPFEVQLARAQQQLVDAKMKIVTRRLDLSKITAPMDGVVVSGDLRQSIGSAMARGDPLFSLAPLQHWTLELLVPEAASADLAVDLPGSFASYARPEDLRTFRTARVLASAQAYNAGNVYVAEARIDARGDWMRPGMEGIAKIRIGRRPVWWITLHRAIDHLRIHFWL